MKKLFCASALAAISGLLTEAQAQTLITTFIQEGDSCYFSAGPGHFSGVYGSVSNPTPNMNALIYWGDGTSSSTTVYSQGGNGSFWTGHNFGLPGVYNVMAVLQDASGNSVDTAYTDVNAFCSTLFGRMYKRNDANCTFDLTDDALNLYQEIEVRKNNIPIDTIGAWGYFFYNIPNPDITAEYSLHPLTAVPGYVLACPSASTPHKVRLDTLTAYNSAFDFGFDCGSSTVFDLNVQMSGLLRFVNNSYLYLTAGNVSCTGQNGTVTLNIDPQYVFQSASPAQTSVSGQTVTWNLSNLSGTNSQYITVLLTPNGTLTPGDSSCHTVSIAPVSGDINPANNSFQFCDTIRASFDPNDKKVSPMGYIAAGQELTYTINFENLGNDTAFNVHILDTLSALLDASSFEMLTSSHPVQLSQFAYNGTKIIRFDFKDINLADKDHPLTNKGFVMYKAKAKSNLEAGDEIYNTGHIYFDINPAVVTNTVTSAIPAVNNIGSITREDGLEVYPNPAGQKLFIENKNGSFNQALLINAIGQVSIRQELKKGTNQIRTAALPAGIYYLVISGHKASRSVKITLK